MNGCTEDIYFIEFVIYSWLIFLLVIKQSVTVSSNTHLSQCQSAHIDYACVTPRRGCQTTLAHIQASKQS